ncbi:La-related protein 4 [Merluccius polli]|uniref:La-related protein 4 n=1 Tax=Merluccius polli TaxID=89951 RepID=A0AA47MJW6_MERPO|nr:La-related protein 4 [Merluccius polli]
MLQVTTKGVGLNPNAKVWQEIPAPQNGLPESPEDAPWLQTSFSPGEVTEGYSEVAFSEDKGYSTEYSDTSDGIPALAVDGLTNGIEQPDFGYPLFEQPAGTTVDGELPKEEPLSEESLRESLKKQLEFCFSRENLCKDLYLMSQMDSDQFVPIWTLACMEDIKVLTTNMELILDVLKASPMVEVDETGEKVRPNHKRCIIILREVPETTPVEEVEALFKSDSCPKVISVEFAHNSNWYITFQSDTDAQQAYKYLREEVKMFQGKPIMARIKAISTFFANNSYRSVDSSVYSQHAQPQQSYSSPMYMQQVYSSQQQYPVYPLVTPSWNPSVTPYFETPLAPFPNSGFVNSYNGSAPYKGGSSNATAGRTFNRSRPHVKSHPRPGDLPSLLSGNSREGGSAPTSPQPPQTPVAALGTTQEPVVMPSLHIRDMHIGELGRGRRGGARGMRRRREDDRTLRPSPLIEVKVPPPKFDLASSSFPPLPGCVVTCTQEESVPETRLSDVVRGLRATDKAENKEEKREIRPSKAPEGAAIPPAVVPVAVAPLHTPATPLIVVAPVPSVAHQTKTALKTNSTTEKAEPSVPTEVIQASTEPVSLATSEPIPAKETTCSRPGSPATVSTTAPSLALESRKLSYAEVCQRPAKDPLPAQPPSPSSSPAPEASQPLRELGVNKAEEPRTSSNHSVGRGEKPGDSRPPREPLGSYRGGNGPARAAGAGVKGRERPRGPPPSRRFAPQGATRRSGKEQNIPPRSPK